MVAVATGFALVAAGFLGWLAVVSFRPQSGDGYYPPAGWVCGGLALAAVAVAARSPWTRVDLTAVGLVDRGVLGTRVYPAELIAEVAVEESRKPLKAAYVVLVAQGSRKLFAGSGPGTYPDRVKARLDLWLAGIRP
jgi:hypothetical protein